MAADKRKVWIVSSLAGGAAFPTTLALFQSAVFKPLRLTSGKPSAVLASILGCGSVLCASGIASLSCLVVANHLSDKKEYLIEPSTVGISTVLGFCVFKGLGGRFRAVLPSHLFRPGAFAVESIPARNRSYAQTSERSFINLIGKKRGCHSCGKRVAEYIADHQPLNKLSIPGTLQRFYPHCRRCSSLQGGLLRSSNLSSSKAVVTHGSALRLYHLFLPLPLFVPVIAQYVRVEGLSGGGSPSTELVTEDSSSKSSDPLSNPNQTTTSDKNNPSIKMTEEKAVQTVEEEEIEETVPLTTIEVVPVKALHYIREYLSIFPSGSGQVYALVHVCILLASVSNLVLG